jgi:hypothetical protein
VTAVYNLPSGTKNDRHREDITATVSGDGKQLLLIATWPEALANIPRMHEFWDTDDFMPGELRDFTRRQISLENAVDAMKDNSRDLLKSTATIELPFLVQKRNISTIILEDDGGVNMIYVTMVEDKKSDFNNAPVLTMKRKRVNGDGGRAGMPGPPFNCKNVPDPRYEN